MIGETFAHFRITAKLGEGGMGTVYRAEDSKLGRDVALKFLPEAFAADAERMARFTREAQVLASLNHPNIAGIFSVEEVHREGADLRFLVMELVEGETLEERIGRGRLPLDEALQITLQLAIGLEEAHERGIVHRDLKPANIKLTPGKQVKILDFGLAKAFDPDATSDSMPSGEAQRLSLSPTMTGLATQVGMLLGTAAYMSPEQARGEPADRRADIWALGTILMEMLVGEVIHGGKTVSDTLASVLARDPAWDKLPADTPRAVRRLLERCLVKDSHQRLRDVGEARIAIEHYLADPTADVATATTQATAVATVPAWRRLLPWVAAAGLAVALVATLYALWPQPGAPERPVRLNLALPQEQTLFSGYGAAGVLSPDGSRVAYVLGNGNDVRVHLQAFDQWDGRELAGGPGMDRAYQPFFSPDGQWVGFVTPNELRKVPVGGGTPIKLCDADRPRGSSWGPDGTIVFAPSPAGPLMRVPQAGGEPQPLTELDEAGGELTHRWPQWLPGGRAVIFTSHTQATDFDRANIEVLDVDTGTRRVIQQGGTYGRYVEAEDGMGFVVYANSGSLFALPFDVERLQVTGSAAPVIGGVTSGVSEGSAQYSTSSDGKLIYSSGRAGVLGHEVVWVDRDGNIETLWSEERFYRNPAFSPDGKRLAVDIVAEGQADIWLYDIARGVPMRLTFSDERDTHPVWSPDGTLVYYSGTVNGKEVVLRKPVDGSADPAPVLELEGNTRPASISSDGKWLAFQVQSGSGGDWNIGVQSLEDFDTEPQMLLTSEFFEVTPRFSPNGRWLAYASTESGNINIYVRSVEGGGKWQISSDGGVWPQWSPDGTELYYAFGETRYVVDVDTEGPSFTAGRSKTLYEGSFADIGFADPMAVTPDGRRFVGFRSKAVTSPELHQHLQVVLNWDDELRATFGD